MSLTPETSRGRTYASIYLAFVAATLAFVVATFTIIEGDGTANLSPVWLVFVTWPWSMVLVATVSPGRRPPELLLIAGFVLSAGLNAALLGKLGDRASR